MKKLKVFTALAVAATMAFSMVVNATAPPVPTHVQGTNVLVNPVYSVLLPTAPAIRINPLQIGSIPATQAVGNPTIPNPAPGDPGHVDGVDPGDPIPNPAHIPANPGTVVDQVSSDWLVIANRSSVPVSINMRVAASAPAATAAIPATEFVANAAATTAPGGAAGVRRAFLELQFANAGVTTLPGGGNGVITNAATAANLSALNWTVVDTPDTNNRQPVVAAGTGAAAAMEGGYDFRILLDAHQYNIAATGVQTIQAGNMNVNQFTAFRFGGAVDPAITWTAGQVAARIVFTISPVNILDYAELMASNGGAGPARNVTLGGTPHRVFAIATP